MHRCTKCQVIWHDEAARRNEYLCYRTCGGQLALVPPLGLSDLEGCDFSKLPYPLALTADRLAKAMQSSSDNLRSLFLLKDCFEAAIKYFAVILLAEFRLLPEVCTTERKEALLKKLVRPALGDWVNEVVRPLSFWLLSEPAPLGSAVAALFAISPKRGGKPSASPLWESCSAFVSYRNSAIGHGAQRPDSHYEDKLREFLPLISRLLEGVLSLKEWRLSLVTTEGRCQLWMGTQIKPDTEPRRFSRREFAHFVLRGKGGKHLDLYPFLCYLLVDSPTERWLLHYYDWLPTYKPKKDNKKKAEVLEYDSGYRYPRVEPIGGLEETFTVRLLEEAFNQHRGRMVEIEGRVANFSELIESHAAIVGRSRVIERVRRFVKDDKHDRGLLVIVAQPGKGKTALMAHLIDEVFDNYSPKPVHFFYRATAGFNETAVCVRSLYYSLLEAHGMTEAEESRQQNSEGEVFNKLTHLLKQKIEPRLTPDRPQLIFIDALDEARRDGAATAFQRIPEDLPKGVFVIATTRPVQGISVPRSRTYVEWCDLDSPEWQEEDEKDCHEFVRRELQEIPLPAPMRNEIVRVSGGNFLVLKHLCQHFRNDSARIQVATLMSDLATVSGPEKLSFIYENYWQRLIDRCTRDEATLLSNVGGALITAKAPLTKGVLCKALNLLEYDWEFALAHLAGYLTEETYKEDSVTETFYRIYHETFAAFLRTKLKDHRQRYLEYLIEFCLSWQELPEGYGNNYALKYGVRHVLDVPQIGEVQFMRMRKLLDGDYLDEKAKNVGFAEALDDTKRMAEVLAKAGEKQWDLFRHCVYCHCGLIEKMRGKPRALEKWIQDGEFGRVDLLLQRDQDLFRKGLTMVALAPLAEAINFTWSWYTKLQGEKLLDSTLKGEKTSVQGHSRTTTALAFAFLFRARSSIGGSFQTRPWLLLRDNYSDSKFREPPGPDWMWMVLARSNKWFGRFWILLIVCPCFWSAFHKDVCWPLYCLVLIAFAICYFRVMSRFFKRKQAALLGRYKRGMETARAEERPKLLRQALDLASWDVPKPEGWHEVMAAILQSSFPLLTDAPTEAARIAFEVTDSAWPAVGPMRRWKQKWQEPANQFSDWQPVGDVIIRALNRLNEEDREAIRKELYALLGKRKPSLRLIRLFAETSNSNSDTHREAFLQMLATIGLSSDKVSINQIGRAIQGAPAQFLGRAALTSLGRDTVEERFHLPLVFKVLFVLVIAAPFLLYLAVVLVLQLLVPRRHGPFRLAQVLEGTTADKRRKLAGILEEFNETDLYELRPLRDSLLAQAILRKEADLLRKLKTTEVYKRLLDQLEKEKLLNQAEIVLQVMDNRHLLDVTMKKKIVAREIEETEDEEQVRRVLPLQPVGWSWFLTAGISSLITALCLASLAMFSDSPQKELLNLGLIESIGLCLIFATYQHIFSFLQSGQLISRFLDGKARESWRVLLFAPRNIMYCLQKMDIFLDNLIPRSLGTILLTILFLVLAKPIYEGVSGPARHLASRIQEDGLPILLIPLVAVNLLTPACIALGRGSRLLYPTPDCLTRRRVASLAAVMAICLVLIALYMWLGWHL